jgi:hypothetical protein
VLRSLVVLALLEPGILASVSSEQRTTWLAHPNVDGPASMLLAVHDQFRGVSNRLVKLANAGASDAAIAQLFVPLAEVLHHHHHAEEAMVFPLVLRQTGTAPDQLQTDHDEMTASISDVERILRARTGDVTDAIRRFHDILIAHLDREETLVMPVFLALAPNEAWDMIHGAR